MSHARATRRIAVLDAPTNLGLRPPAPGREPGCRLAPTALREHGLLPALGAVDAGIVPAPRYRHAIDDTGTANGQLVAQYAQQLAGRVEALVRGGDWPLVVGGDCSILLGTLLGMRRRGPVGLIFVDGHLDFRQAGTGDLGAVAGEDLALVTGRGHRTLADLEQHGPLVADEHVVALGNNEWDEESLPARDTELTILDADAIRRVTPQRAAQGALATLHDRGVDDMWLHLDVDVLDAALMPAVDSPNPGGLEWRELEALLATLLDDPLIAGMELTVFDPGLDADGRLGRQLVALLANVVRPRSTAAGPH